MGIKLYNLNAYEMIKKKEKNTSVGIVLISIIITFISKAEKKNRATAILLYWFIGKMMDKIVS